MKPEILVIAQILILAIISSRTTASVENVIVPEVQDELFEAANTVQRSKRVGQRYRRHTKHHRHHPRHRSHHHHHHEYDYPSEEAQYPTYDNQYPREESQYPTDYTQNASYDNQYPTDDNQFPTDDDQNPTDGDIYHDADGNLYPSDDNQDSTADNSDNESEEGQKGRSFLSATLGNVFGTTVSAVNAIGQTVQNFGGDVPVLGGLLGGVGKLVTDIGKGLAGRIKFVLYTKANPKKGIEVKSPESVAKTTFNPEKELIIVIHGFSPAGYFEKPEDNLVSMYKIKDGLIKANVTNIILVDWTSLSSDMTYIFSSTSTSTTADEVSDFIISLVDHKLTKYSKIRLIGHSLGAHTVGITAMRVKDKTTKMIRRIDGIDPAGPNFDHALSRFQLGPSDAKFVQAIHCNKGFLGTAKNRGHVDFYPNGGDHLPGCEDAPAEEKKERKKRFITDTVTKDICNHVRCIDLYVESIQDPQKGCECDSWENFQGNECKCEEHDQPVLGYQCPETAKGVYYLKPIMHSEFKKYPDSHTHTEGADGKAKEEDATTAAPAS